MTKQAVIFTYGCRLLCLDKSWTESM